MYEGKNIHHSSTDNKLLCSFSGKLCNQRRLNGYGFCVRHILEDPTAPFKRCAYVAKSSNQMCTQAIPKNEDRRYCNNHMQVLGMLPKKERKKKDKVTPVISSLSESGLLLPNGGLALKPKFSLSVNKDSSSSRSTLQLTSTASTSASSVGDSDDPYAFSDSAPLDNSNKTGGFTASSLSATIDSVLGKSLQTGTGFVRSASDIGGSTSTSTLGTLSAGGSMIAKYYPELAEKLEKMRAAKPEPKASPKSRAKSSRTMNKLQTKIAQNKINEKLRKSQELNLSQTDSNSSPIQLSSPEAGGIIVDQSPGSSPAAAFSPNISSLSFSPQSSSTGFYQPSSVSANLSNFEIAQQQQKGQEVPPLPQIDTSLLATLATQDNMGFQTAEVEITANSGSSRLLPPHHTPPRLPPPPYPGSSVLSQQPSALTPSDLAAAAFGSPQHNVTTVIDNSSPAGLSARLHHHLQQQNLLTSITTTTTATAASGAAGKNFSTSSATTSVSSLPFTPPSSISGQQHLSKIATPLFLSPTSTNPALAFSPSLSSSSSRLDHHISTDHSNIIKTLPNHHLSTLPQLASSSSITNSADIFSLLNNINRKPLMVDTKSSQHIGSIPSPNTVAAQLSLPPPPPYVPPKVSLSTTSSMSSSSLQTSSSSSTTNLTGQMPVTSSRIKQQNVPPILTTTAVPHMKLRKLKGVLSEKEALAKLRTESAANYYSFYAKQRVSNHSLVGPYLCSSDEDSVDEDSELLPWQPDIFSASSDDQDDDGDDEFDTNIPMSMRPTKLSLMKTRVRRQWHQAHQAYKSNQATAKTHNQATLALIQTVRESGACAVRALWHIRHVKKSKKKLRKMLPKKKKTCFHKSSTDGPCTNPCLPYTNHCLRHIMYNIDQQIFDYCTAKFADNTQCCMPVFDIRHELPLCPVHAAKADNYQRQMELENKKKPRKKSKPAALTRPPRKGKKKKKGRYTRQQKALAAAETGSGGLDSTLSDIDVLGVDTLSSQPHDADDSSTAAIDVVSTSSDDKSMTTPPSSTTSSSSTSTTSTTSLHPTISSSASSSSPLVTSSSNVVRASSSSSSSSMAVPTAKDRSSSITSQQMEQALELEETLLPDFDKQFELPLEQASRLLEESDLQEVVNKMPFEALDLFGKQGDADQEETDQIPLDQVSANKARDTIEKLLCGAMSEEESMQLAMVLAQNLHTDAELAQNTVALITGEGGSSVSGAAGDSSAPAGGLVAGLDNPSGQILTSGVASHSSGASVPMETQETGFVVQGPNNANLQTQHHHQQQQQQQQRQSQPHQHQLPSSHPALHGISGYSSTGHQVQFDPSTMQPMKRSHLSNPTVNITTTTTSSMLVTSSLQSSPLSSSLSSAHHQRPTSQSLSSSLSQPTTTMFGQIDPFSLSPPSQQITTSQNLQQQQQQQIPSYSGFIAKTLVRHLPTETQPVQTLGRVAVSTPNQTVAGLTIAMGAGDANAKMLVGGNNQVLLNSSNAGAKESSKMLTIGAPNRTVDLTLQRDLRIERPQSSSASSSSLSSSSSVLSSSSSLSLPSLAKKAKLMSSSPLSSSASVMQQSTQESNKYLKQQSLEQNLQIKHLKQLQQQQQQQQQTSSPSQQHLLSTSPLKSGQLNLIDPSNTALSSPTMMKLSKPPISQSPSPSSSSSSDQNLIREITGSPKSHSHTNMGSPKLKLMPPKTPLSSSDLTSSSSSAAKLNKLILPNTKSHTPSSMSSSSSSLKQLPSSSSSPSSVLLLPQEGSASNMYKGIGISASPNSSISNNVRYSITTNTSNASSFTSPLQKSLNLSNDDDDDSPSESISVTVRHPSSLEAVPTTVRHTLPDTFPSHDSLPSSPLQLLPKSSSVVNSPTRSLTSSPSPQQQSTSASSSPHRLSLDSSNHFKQFKSSSPSSSTSSLQQPTSSDFHSVLSSQLQRSSQWTPSPPPPLPPTHQQNLNTTSSGLTNGGLPSLKAAELNKSNLKINHSTLSSSLSSPSIASKLNLASPQSTQHHPHSLPQSLTLSHHSNSGARKTPNNPNLTTLPHPGSAVGVVGSAKQLHVQPGAMPVVTMTKFTPPLPATVFKTSGTS